MTRLSGHMGTGPAALWSMAAAALLPLLGAGCSHTTPYAASPGVVEGPPADGGIRHRIVLFGDGGAPSIDATLPDGELYRGDATLTSLYRWASQAPRRTTVIFLGDNIYGDGLPENTDAGYEEAENRLQAQLDVIQASGARAIFIPGNHDWADGKKGGWAAVLRQEAYVNRALGGGSFLPGGGHPGPAKVDRDGLRIIVLDSQWWLHRDDDKPAGTEGETARISERLRGLLQERGRREAIVVAHHPLESHGSHGGFFDWRDHLFPFAKVPLPLIGRVPLPILGSLYPLGRWHLVRSNQDLSGPRNRVMVREVKEALSGEHRPLIHAAGHDHNLQVLHGVAWAEYALVSGSGSKTSKVGRGAGTLFAHEHPGFMAVDFMEDGTVLLRVVEPGGRKTVGRVVYSRWLRARPEGLGVRIPAPADSAGVPAAPTLPGVARG